jgi:hypothetical protein
MELTKEIREILENVVWWESCPDDYKEKITTYLANGDNKALNIDPVMWRCNKDLFMDGRGDRVFTKGELYEQVTTNPLSLYDDEGEKHVVENNNWIKYFHAT